MVLKEREAAPDPVFKSEDYPFKNTVLREAALPRALKIELLQLWQRYRNFKGPFSTRGRVPMDLWVVNDTIRRVGWGMFRALPRSERPGSGGIRGRSVVEWVAPLGSGRFVKSAPSAPPGARGQCGRCRPPEGVPVFHTVHAQTATELQALLLRIIKRLMKFLTRKGFLIGCDRHHRARGNADGC